VIIPSSRFLGWKEFNHDGEWQLKVGVPAKESGDLPPDQQSAMDVHREADRRNLPQLAPGHPTSLGVPKSVEFGTLGDLIQTIQRLPPGQRSEVPANLTSSRACGHRGL
jgi:hypothetical protein